MSVKGPLTRGGGIVLATILLASVLTNAVLLAAGTSSPSASATPASGVYFDHVVVIMLENEGVGDICGGNPPPCNGANTPYLSSLANRYGIGQQYVALINTSWPNYYGITGASIFGCPSNCYPAPGSVTATNLVDRFEAASVSWRGYFENQGVAAGCVTTDHEPYTYIHNPFVLFQDITSNSARCNNLVLANPSGCAVTDCALINDLNSGAAPNFMWLTPSDCDNMRGNSVCSNGCTVDGSTTCLNDGDSYLKSLVPNILSSAAFQSGRSALFVTFDEGLGYCPVNNSSENCVYAVWAGPLAKTNFVTSNFYNHYSLTKTVEVNWNLASLTSNDAAANPMSEFFAPASSGFSMATNPSSSFVMAGSSNSTTLSLTSIGGFAGSVNLTATVSPAGPQISLNPSVVTLSPGGSASSRLSISTTTSTPDGSYNVTATGTSGGVIRKTTWTVNVASSLPYSLMVSNDGRVFKYLQSGTMTQIGQPVTSPLRQVAWKPDGSYALIVGDQSVLLKYNGATLTRISTSIGGNPALYSVAWRPDGSYALIAGQAGIVLKYDGTNLTRITDTNTNNLRSVSWKPDGTTALIVGDKGTALIYAGSGSISNISSGTGQPLFAVSWDQTGSYALASGGGGVVLRYDGTAFKILSTSGLAPTGKNIRSVGFGTADIAVLVGDSGLFWTFNGTRLSSISSGTNQNLFSASWLNRTAYAVGQQGTILSYSNGVMKKLASTSTSQLNGISWKPFIAPILHTSSTSLACNPSTMAVGASTTCTVTVADSSTTPSTPTGTISLTESGVTGTFTPCTLTGTNASSMCTSTFAASSSGTAAITSQYPGDNSHQPSSGTTSVIVNKRTTTTTVNCTSPVTSGTSSTCNVTVADVSAGSFVTPTGTVSLSTNGTGTFAGTCALSGNTSSATCSATYTPSGNGPRQDTVNATYLGDTAHSGGSGAFTISIVAVAPHSTTTVVSCNTPVVVNQGSTCTVTVTDTSSNPTTPTGSVTFNATGITGSLNPSGCSLASGSCSVTFTPSAIGSATITAVYNGDSTHVNSAGQTNVSSTARLSGTTINCSPATIPDNTTSTCTVTVTDASGSGTVAPTGTVTFTTNSTGVFSSSTCTVASGSCSANYAPSVTGHAMITGSFGGDSVHSGSVATFTLTSTVRTSSTSLTCAPAGVGTGQATTCTVTVSDSSGTGGITPTGTVTFSTNSTGTFTSATCTLSTGSCSATYTPVIPGHHIITGTYGGDSVHSGSGGSAHVVVGVIVDQTTTSISCSPSNVLDNTSASCTATVTDTSSNPTTPSGAVGFTTNSTGSFSPASCTLTGSTASATCTVTYTPTVVGHHLITSNYSGDSSHTSSSGQFTLISTIRSSSTSVSCSPSPVNTGATTTCTATMSDSSGAGAVTPTGSVAFESNATGTFGSATCTLSGGSCSVTYTPSVSGHSLITGTYGGDGIHTGGSAAFSLSVGVNVHSSTTFVSCSPGSVSDNTPTSCTVTVTDTNSSPTTPSGTVTFATNSTGTFTQSGSCTLAGSTSTATCGITYTPSVVGHHVITSNYLGDSDHLSSSGQSKIASTIRSSTTSVTCVPASVITNAPSTCTVSVADSSGTGTITPTGTVTYGSNSTGSFSSTSCTLSAGSCSVAYTPTVVGHHLITGSYSGDASHLSSQASFLLASTSAPPHSTTTSVSCSPSSPTTGATTSCTATVTDTSSSPTNLTGTVNFVTNSTGTFSPGAGCNLTSSGTLGVSTCAISYTPGVAGGHRLTGTYAGDSGHASSSGSTILTVTSSVSSSPYALVVSEQGSVFKYQNGTFTLIGQPVTTPLREVSWKPDGSYALIVGDSGVLLKYDGTQITSIQTGITSNLYTISWRPDGSYALIDGSGGPLFKYDGTLTRLSNSFSNSIRSISWNPSGTQALLAGASGGLFLYQASTGSISQISSGTTAYFYSSAWSATGLYALAAGDSGAIVRIDGTTVTPFNTVGLYNSTYILHAISWNPTGTTALLVGDGGTILTYDGSKLTALQDPVTSNLYSISWLGSTAYIAGGSGYSVTYTNGALSLIANNTGASLRGWAWKPN